MPKIDFLECDLETIIESTPFNVLANRGLDLDENSTFLRQVRLGEYGIADLICLTVTSGEITQRIITVIELKQNEINTASLLQLSRYINAVRVFFIEKYGRHIHLRGFLIGKTLDLKSDFIYLAGLCDNVHIYTYGLDINGFYFDQVNHWSYSLVQPGQAKSFAEAATDFFEEADSVDPEEEQEESEVEQPVDDMPF